MAEEVKEKEKAGEKIQETKPPAGAKKDELPEEDLKKVAGGNCWPVKHVLPS